MYPIQSKENSLYKTFLKVGKHKEKSMALLEGVHLCRSYLDTLAKPLWVIVEQGKEYLPEILELWQQVKEDKVINLSPHLFRKLSEMPTPHGIFFVIQIPEAKSGLHLPVITTESSLLLDRLQDPGNLGTIIRTAAAAGIRHLVLSENCVNPWSSKVLRSAQGAHFYVDLHMQCDLKQIIQGLRQKGVPVFATVLNAQAHSLYALRIPRICAWMLGNEGQGIRSELVALADQSVFIPQTDLVESLNIGVACALVLFEQRRQYLNGIMY